MSDTPLNRHHAEGTAAQIKADLVTGNYDPTLVKYKPAANVRSRQTSRSTVDLFEQFTEQKRRNGVSAATILARYTSMKSNIARHGVNIASQEDAMQLVEMIRARQSSITSNHNLILLKSFGRWLKEQQLAEENYFALINPLKRTSNAKQDRTPFTKREVKSLLNAMKSHPTAYRYYDFTLVLFSLGLRPSEAIGLRWCHINMDRREVTIRESMGRSIDSYGRGTRQRKGTKTGKVRTLPLNDLLLSMFAGRLTAESQPDDLVFIDEDGRPVCDRKFRESYWRPLLKELNIPYRPPYTARHTFISHGIEYKNWSPQQAAAMAGHSNTRMVADVYGHMMEKPELPDI